MMAFEILDELNFDFICEFSSSKLLICKFFLNHISWFVDGMKPCRRDRTEEAVKLRKQYEDCGKNNSGRSMIEIDGNVYEFMAGESINNVQVCILYDLVLVNIVFYLFVCNQVC